MSTGPTPDPTDLTVDPADDPTGDTADDPTGGTGGDPSDPSDISDGTADGMADGAEPTAETLWAGLIEVAATLNDLSSAVSAHDRQLEQLAKKPPPTVPRKADPDVLTAWVEDLIEEYGLRAQLARWETVPALRAELVGLMVADVRSLKLPAGSFELVYWHDALARVCDRVNAHRNRWTEHTSPMQALLTRA